MLLLFSVNRTEFAASCLNLVAFFLSEEKWGKYFTHVDTAEDSSEPVMKHCFAV